VRDPRGVRDVLDSGEVGRPMRDAGDGHTPPDALIGIEDTDVQRDDLTIVPRDCVEPGRRVDQDAISVHDVVRGNDRRERSSRQRELAEIRRREQSQALASVQLVDAKIAHGPIIVGDGARNTGHKVTTPAGARPDKGSIALGLSGLRAGVQRAWTPNQGPAARPAQALRRLYRFPWVFCIQLNLSVEPEG
jgi:hypothetical protein